MKHTVITFRQTIQLKQFEPVDISITAELDENDNLESCINQLRDEVQNAITNTGTPVKKALVKETARASVTPPTSPNSSDENF